jgi:hypothetical protein
VFLLYCIVLYCIVLYFVAKPSKQKQDTLYHHYAQASRTKNSKGRRRQRVSLFQYH